MPPCGRRSAQGVRRADHHRPRAQAAAARDPHRRRRDCRPRQPNSTPPQLRVVWEGGHDHRAHRDAARAPAATPAAPTRTRSRSCASSPSATPTSRSPRSSPAKRRLHRRRQPVHRPPRRTGCAPTTRSPPLPSERPATMARWSRSPRPPASSTCQPRPCTAGCARGSSPASRSPPARPGRSGSPTSFAQRVCEQAPDGWLPLAQAANALGVARQTVLHKVQRGELAAVYVHNGKRKGLRIQVKPEQTGLFENDIREETQC